MLNESCAMLSALWPLYLAMLAIRKNKIFDMTCSEGTLATTVPFSDGCYQFGRFNTDIAEKVLHCDAHKADAPGAWAQHKKKLLAAFVTTDNDANASSSCFPLCCKSQRSSAFSSIVPTRNDFNYRLREKAAG